MDGQVLLGRDDEAKLPFEWYYPGETPVGVRLRWTDDLAALALGAKRSARGVEVTFCFPEEGAEAFGNVLFPDSGWVSIGQLPKSPPFRWTDIELDASLPEGFLQLILRTLKPYREPHSGGTFLGATHRCRVMSYRPGFPAGGAWRTGRSGRMDRWP